MCTNTGAGVLMQKKHYLLLRFFSCSDLSSFWSSILMLKCHSYRVKTYLLFHKTWIRYKLIIYLSRDFDLFLLVDLDLFLDFERFLDLLLLPPLDRDRLLSLDLDLLFLYLLSLDFDRFLFLDFDLLLSLDRDLDPELELDLLLDLDLDLLFLSFFFLDLDLLLECFCFFILSLDRLLDLDSLEDGDRDFPIFFLKDKKSKSEDCKQYLHKQIINR